MTEEKRTYQADFLTELFRNPLDEGYAAAAKVRAARGPLPRGRKAFRRLITYVALIVVGLVLTVAYQQVVAKAPERETVRSGLIQEVKDSTKRANQMAADAEGLQDEVARLREAALPQFEIERIRELEGATGFRAVTGDGVVIRLSDGPEAATEPKTAQVLDFDLQQVANTLWSLGAEAISINGQRLTSLTPIRKGSVIMVGDAPVVGPYEISAIGPDLADRFNASDTAALYRMYHKKPKYELGFEVDERDDLTLPAAVLPDLVYATNPDSPHPSSSASSGPSAGPSGGGK